MTTNICGYNIIIEDIESIIAQLLNSDSDPTQEWSAVDLGNGNGIVHFNVKGTSIFLEELEAQGF